MSNQLPAEIYLMLLNAVEHLERDIAELNPGVDHTQLRADIQELYDMINGYTDGQPDTGKGEA